MVSAEHGAAFHTGFYLGKALFFLAIAAVLVWVLGRWRHRR
jgi:hypothetical protein